LKKLRGLDRIDPIYKNPLSYLQRFLGGSLHWCPLCRLQFYDRRKRAPPPKAGPEEPSLADKESE